MGIASYNGALNAAIFALLLLSWSSFPEGTSQSPPRVWQGWVRENQGQPGSVLGTDWDKTSGDVSQHETTLNLRIYSLASCKPKDPMSYSR